MLARLHILMPYAVLMGEGEEFPIFETTEGDYKVRFFPPVKSGDAATSNPSAANMTLDGRVAYEANLMRIDFYKNEFSRKHEDPLDPPEPLIRAVVADLHARLRFITRAYQAKPVSFPWNRWRLDYLNDDESPLEEKAGHFRARGSLNFEFSFIAMNRAVWESMHTLPASFEVPVWDTLRLDALAALPNVGASVVLAATCLEVFISLVLDALALKQGFPPDLWSWINERGGKKGNPLRQPSVDEQFDVLLKHLCGHSLKEESGLWAAFMNLKTARNTFVHEGVAKIGNDSIDKNVASKLIGQTNEIIEKIRGWLPEDLRWPEPVIKPQISWTQMLIQPTPDSGIQTPLDNQDTESDV